MMLMIGCRLTDPLKFCRPSAFCLYHRLHWPPWIATWLELILLGERGREMIFNLRWTRQRLLSQSASKPRLTPWAAETRSWPRDNVRGLYGASI